MEMNKFSKMIERLEDLILSGIGVPFTPWTVLNGDRLIPLLDRIRESLPEEMRMAQNVLAERDEILAEARQKGAQILQEAKIQAEGMLSDSELLKAVHQEAERVREQIVTELETARQKTLDEADSLRGAAQNEAQSVREEANKYADAILTTLDKSLAEFQTIVREGQRQLRKVRGPDASGKMPVSLQSLYGNTKPNPMPGRDTPPDFLGGAPPTGSSMAAPQMPIAEANLMATTAMPGERWPEYSHSID